MNGKAAMVFRIQLLPRSETFISAQAGAMRTYTPFFAGWRRMAGLDLPASETWVANNGGVFGRLRELQFRYAGPTRRQVASLRSRGPRLIYAHFALDGYAALPLAQRLDLPLITALHGYDVTMHEEAIGSTRLGREYLRGVQDLHQRCALFITGSEYLRRKAIAQGFPADRTVTHYIGVDTQRFQPPATFNREPLVLFVGRLVEKKGCGTLLEAMAAVQRRQPEAELVVIGDGPLRATFEARAAELGLRCRFLGGQSSAVVQQWMRRASVFCVPSLIASTGDAEGFGIVFIEAQAMGLPVVSTRSGGIPEAVAHGETGLLVAERDAEALADSILTLLTDHSLWSRFSEAGRRRVLENFDLAACTRHLETHFDRLAS